jgi:hypothetical protein
MLHTFSLEVQNMGLKRMLSGNWFTRIVMIILIICSVSIIALFKNIELIVHGQLYNYGLQFSPDWADPYRLLTWLIYLCLGLPMALGGLALVSSFLKVEEGSDQENTFPQRIKSQQAVAKAKSGQVVREVPNRVEYGNGDGISCPRCKKVFGRALVMLDFHNGKNQLVSVCPYCNYALGNTNSEKCANEKFQVNIPDEKIIHEKH